MEFGQILVAQGTSIISLLFLFIALDNTYIQRLSKFLYSISFLNISDDKGLFLCSFMVYMILFTSFIEIMRISARKNFTLRDKIVYIQTCNFNNSFILFANFLSIYIYKKLCTRTLNLLIYSICNSFLYNICYLADFRVLSGFFYLNFVLANLVSVMFTYVSRFDHLLDIFMIYYKGVSGGKYFN
jgi:hypothetical protein